MIRNFLLLILFATACSTPNKERTSQQSTEPESYSPASSEQLDNKPSESLQTPEIENHEVLDIDSVWLNDAIGFSENQQVVLDKLGEPDSISTPNFECGGYVAGEEPWGETVNIWHYEGAQIVTFKERAELMRIKLIDWDWTFHHYRFIFSEHTTLEELAEEFPKSVEQSYDVQDVNNGRTYRMVRILPKPISDDWWMLRFYENKLVDIEYWIGC